MSVRRTVWPRRAAGALLAFVTIGALIGGTALPAGAALLDPLPGQLAAAIDAQTPSIVSGAALARPPSGTPDMVSTTPLASFPTDSSSYAILSTGDANQAANAPQSNFASVNDNGPNVRGNTDFDVSTLRVNFTDPPVGVENPAPAFTCLRIDFRFLSEEFPEYLGSQFNDAFIAELDGVTWTTSNSAINAPNNFAFDPDHNPITINSTGFTHMTAAEAAGTTYDGATPVLVAQTPIATSGPHSVYFSIFDQGDQVFDSAAFLDNLSLGTQSEGQCQKGAQPLSNVGLTVDGDTSATVPAGFGSMATAAMNYGALAGPGSAGEAALATAPINHGPINHGPINHGPINHGPINHGPINHGPINHGAIVNADEAFWYAPLSRLPLSHVGPILIASVPIAEPPGPWSQVLSTALAAVPFQTVTLQAAAGSSTAASVSVGDVDLSSTALGGLSPASLLLGNATIQQLGLTPPNGFTGTNSLADVEVAGQSITSLPVAGITLQNKAGSLSSSLISSTLLAGIDWASAPAWNVSVAGLPGSILDNCPTGGCGGETMAQARAGGHFRGDATLGDLLALGTPSLAGKTFGQLLPGIVNVDDFPFESTPLSNILAAAQPDPASQVTYAAAADVPCPIGGTTMAVTLPAHGFTYVPGTGQFIFGAAPAQPALDATALSTTGRTLTWTVPSTGCSTGSQHVQTKFQVEAGPDLGTFSASLSVGQGGVTRSVLDQAAVTTTENFENNDNPATAAPVTPGNLYTDTLSSGNDIDFFKVPVVQGDVGRLVRISLSHVPSGGDYDVVLYGEAPSDASLRGAPINHGPINHGPINHGPLADDSECVPPGTVLQPQTLEDVPQVDSATLGIRGYSTNRGTGSDFACTIVQPSDVGNGIIVQVSSYLGVSRSDAALLHVQESPATNPLPCLAVPDGNGSPGPALPASLPDTTQTLFLVNEQAVGKWYGPDGEAEIHAAISDSSFLSKPNVQGAVLSVDRNPAVAQAYLNWYGDYCSPDKANAVVHAINNLVDSYRSSLPNLRNVVLVGSDAVMPFARIQELVNLGGESTQAANIQYNGKDNPTSRALSLGYMLSDDPYYSFQPAPWLSTNVYPPSVAGGRLVETPADIAGAIAQYKLSNGALPAGTEFTTGYDFFGDVAQAQDGVLHSAASGLPYDYPKSGPTTFPSKIDTSWTATDVKNAVDVSPGILALNAHADQYRFEPAATFHGTSPDLYSTADLALSPLNARTLAFSIGCHAGLSIPDVWVAGSNPTSLDWAQGFSQKNGLLVGNTGFGYGDDKVIAYSEKLVLDLAKNLDGSMSVGQAVALAKQHYYAGLGTWGVFDAKSVEEFTPYGLPMYVVGSGGQVAGTSSAPITPGNDPGGLTPSTGLKTHDVTFTSLHSDSPVGPSGSQYFTGPEGLTQAEQYRPIEPITAPRNLTADGMRLHGALVLSFTKDDRLDFHPAISVPTLAPANDQPPPQLTNATFGGYVSTFSQDTVLGRRDSLVAFGGQFIADANAQPNTGTQRLFSNMAVRAFYSNSDQFSMPIFKTITAQDLGATTAFQMTTDSNGVAAAYVTYRLRTLNDFVSQRMDFDASRNMYTASVPGTVGEYIMQMVSSHGDVAVSDDKTVAFPKPKPPPPPPGTPQVAITDATGNPVSPSENGWFNKDNLKVNVTSDAETFTGTLDGGATPQSVPIPVSGNGNHTVLYTGTNGTAGHVAVPIDTTKPTLSDCTTPPQSVAPFTYLLNSNGGSVPLSVSATAGGPSGINASASTLSATLNTTTVGTKTFTFTAVDFAGNAKSVTCTYSVLYKLTGFTAPVDNPPTVNSAKAGQAVPIKWRITDANGVGITDPSSFVSVTSTTGSSCSGTPDVIETYTGSSGLQNLGNGNWQLNWATLKSYAGQCRTMVLHLNDGFTPNLSASPPDQRYAKFTFK